MAKTTNHNGRPSIALSRLTPADGIGIFLLAIVFLTLSYVRSRHRMFWGDEIMGWLVLKQPTWRDQLHLWQAGFDSSGIWFHVFGRLWIAVFGASEISLREFSATALAVSAAVLWIAARRFYSTLAIASSICFVYFGMRDLLWQFANGRSYGLLMLGAASVIFVLFHGEDAETARPSPRFLLATLAAYSLLNGSHTLGMVYAGTFFAVQLALDFRSRRFRPRLYLSVLASFAVIVFSRGNILGTIATGKPTYWTPRPSFSMLFPPDTVFSGRYVGAAILYLLLLVLLLNRRLVSRRAPVYMVLLAFFCLNILLFLGSLRMTSIYVDRYLLPFGLAAVLCLCELLTLVREARVPLPSLRAALPLVLLLLAGCFVAVPRFTKKHWFPYPDYTHLLLSQLPPGVPVVDTDVGTFREVLFYHHGDLGRPFLFPVDWQVALDPTNLNGVSGYHEMDRFKADNFYAEAIQPTAQILATQHRFIVITSLRSDLWLRKRILSDPRYTVQPMGHFRAGFAELNLWLVHD